MRTLLSYFLLPGIIAHEFSHYLACVLSGLPVSKVNWFGPDPHVEHAASPDFRTVLVALAPLFGNGLGGLFAWNVALPLIGAGSAWGWVWLWVAITLLLLAFPSRPDIANAMAGLSLAGKHAWKNKRLGKGLSVALLAIPLYVLFGLLLIVDFAWPLRLAVLIPLLGI